MAATWSTARSTSRTSWPACASAAPVTPPIAPAPYTVIVVEITSRGSRRSRMIGRSSSTVNGSRRLARLTAVERDSRRTVNCQIRHSSKRVEIAVIVVDLRTTLETGRGNQAVDASSDGNPPATRRPIKVRRSLECFETARTQNRMGQKAPPRAVKDVFVTNSLEHLAIHDVDQSDQGIALQELGEVSIEWRTSGLEEVYPYGGVYDDHGRRRRSSARSPSHFTWPRRESRSRRRALLSSSVSARWTRSRFDRHLNRRSPSRTRRSSSTMLVLPMILLEVTVT